MADVRASGTVEAHGLSYHWDLDYVDTADTVTVDATHTHLSDGTPVAETPVKATFHLQDSTGNTFTVDCLTGKFIAPSPAAVIGQDFSQTHSGNMLNAGPIVRTSVRLRVSADRAAGIESGSSYIPPA